MGLFRKKKDPISEKARLLEEQIAALENQIKQLSEEAEKPQPKFRSSTLPRSAAEPDRPAPKPVPPQEHFVPVDHTPLQSSQPQANPAHYNELGVRKYDLLAAWQRLKSHFKSPPASNPKLVNYLAAGSIQGLRPLRYEKRVARNRFIFLVLVLLLMLWGILAVIFRR
jgi:cell division protein FtsB